MGLVIVAGTLRRNRTNRAVPALAPSDARPCHTAVDCTFRGRSDMIHPGTSVTQQLQQLSCTAGSWCRFRPFGSQDAQVSFRHHRNRCVFVHMLGSIIGEQNLICQNEKIENNKTMETTLLTRFAFLTGPKKLASSSNLPERSTSHVHRHVLHGACAFVQRNEIIRNRASVCFHCTLPTLQNVSDSSLSTGTHRLSSEMSNVGAHYLEELCSSAQDQLVLSFANKCHPTKSPSLITAQHKATAHLVRLWHRPRHRSTRRFEFFSRVPCSLFMTRRLLRYARAVNVSNLFQRRKMAMPTVSTPSGTLRAPLHRPKSPIRFGAIRPWIQAVGQLTMKQNTRTNRSSSTAANLHLTSAPTASAVG